MNELLCVLIGYPFGCLLTASLVAKYRGIGSVNKLGTGNPGAANMAGQLGRGWGALTLLGDGLKTAAPCLLCGWLLFPHTQGAILYAGLGAMLGHMYPFWRRFHGGLGVACVSAAMLLYSPLWGAAALLAGLVVLLSTGYVDIASVAIPFAFLPPMLFRSRAAGFAAFLLAAVMLLRHIPALVAISRGQKQRSSRLRRFFRRL